MNLKVESVSFRVLVLKADLSDRSSTSMEAGSDSRDSFSSARKPLSFATMVTICPVEYTSGVCTFMKLRVVDAAGGGC